MSFKIITEKEIVTKEVTEIDVTLLGYIGHKVREAREVADVNISQVSRRLENNGHSLSGTTIGKIEKGLCPLKVEDLVAIANYYQKPVGSFFPEGVL